MRRIRALLDSPQFWVRAHGTAVFIWMALIPPSITWWRDSVPYLVAISVLANVVGSVASWQAARADRNSPTSEDVARLEAKLDVLAGRLSLLTRGR